MTDSVQARQRLTDSMDRRRVALRLQWAEVASEAGMSASHLRRLRNNEAPLTAFMISGLERALRWTPGSIDRILRGDLPIEAPSAASAGRKNPGSTAATSEGGDRNPDSTAGIRAAIRELARTLPPKEVREILDEIRRSEGPGEYADPAEQHLWETPGLSATERRQLIGHLQVMRRVSSAPSRDQPQAADVREFRKRTTS